jgi:predicted ATPase/DNA-binding CsgD family transcriptional regulator
MATRVPRLTQDPAVADPTPADRSVSQLSAPLPLPDRSRLGAHLPSPLTSFVGRRREIEQVSDLLQRADVRLVTLTGPGGVGKTRLAIQISANLAHKFPNGVGFVPLAAIVDSTLVLPTIARALETPEAGERPLLEHLTGFLKSRQVLLVLDNFEQVVDAAPLMTELLTACPGLKVVVTSRITLHVSGEHEFPVPPLSVPPSGHPPSVADLATYDAVNLYVQRARAVQPDFSLTGVDAAAVSAICARLDGLPLAIELAAARSKVLSPQAVLARLENRLALLTGGNRDYPERLRTMREAIAWSYDLLAPHEQVVFRRLAVFAGGCTLEAAEAVVEVQNGTELATLDSVASLADSSLLVQQQQADGETRFSMLETMREFGLERLAAAGEDEVTLRRHADWYLALAEDLWPSVQRRLDPAETIGRLGPEHDNLRAALAWLDSTGNGDGLLRLAGAIYPYWYWHGDLREGLSWLERVPLRNNETPVVIRARALLGMGMLAHYATDDSRAVPALEASLTLYRTTGDNWGQALTLLILGIVAEDSGDYDRAGAHFAEGLVRARTADNPVLTGLVLIHLGVVAWGQGGSTRAEQFLREALDVQRAAGDLDDRDAEPLAFLGLLACEQGDFTQSVKLQRESLYLHIEKGYPEVLAVNLANVAMLAGAIRWPEAAARLFGAAVGQREAIGNPFKLPERDVYGRAIDAARAMLGDDDFAAVWDAGRSLTLADAIAEAFAALDEIERRTTSGAASSRPQPAAAETVAGLTARELEVLRLLVSGGSNKEIADVLFLSPRTVQAHIANIFGKLGVHTRAAAVARAYDLGLA